MLEYLKQHIPETIEFTLDEHWYISSDFPIGVQFQITSGWCAARCIEPKENKSLITTEVLLDAILEHLRETKTQGFGFMPIKNVDKIIGWWWSIDELGDGHVWPMGFGDVVLRWKRPAHLNQMSVALQPKQT